MTPPGRVLSILLALTLAGGQPAAAATTYHVASDGDDAATCLEAAPCRTFTRAGTLMVAGDTLLIHGGTYAEHLRNKVPSGESWDLPVVVAGVPGAAVVIKPTAEHALSAEGDFQFIEYRDLTLDGTNVRSHVVRFGYKSGQSRSIEPHHLRLTRVQVLNGRSQGILTGPHTAFVEFIDLDVHHNGRDRHDHGIYLGGFDHLLKGGKYHDNFRYGVHAYGPGGRNIIDGIEAFGNWGGLVSTQGDNQILNNLLHHNTDGGAHVWGDRTLIAHNTAVMNGRAGIDLVYPFGQDNQVINNILTGNPVPLRDAGTGTQVHHNLIEGEPLFIDAAAGDYRLQASSPAVDEGQTLPEVPTDRAGGARPQGSVSDIGAYELGAPVPDPDPDPDPDPEPPTSPTCPPSLACVAYLALDEDLRALLDAILDNHPVCAGP